MVSISRFQHGISLPAESTVNTYIFTFSFFCSLFGKHFSLPARYLIYSPSQKQFLPLAFSAAFWPAFPASSTVSHYPPSQQSTPIFTFSFFCSLFGKHFPLPARYLITRRVNSQHLYLPLAFSAAFLASISRFQLCTVSLPTKSTPIFTFRFFCSLFDQHFSLPALHCLITRQVNTYIYL